MNPERRVLFLVALLIILSLPVSAAGQVREVVRIFAPTLPGQQANLKALIERSLPHIEAQVDGYGQTGGSIQPVTVLELAERIAQGKYDVVVLSAGTQNLVMEGLLMPLDAFLIRTGFTHRLFPSMRIEGQLYDLPVFIEPWLVVYNQELFDAYGVPYPHSDWTWDEFLAAAERIGGATRTEPLYGAALPLHFVDELILYQVTPNLVQVGDEALRYALAALARIGQESALYLDSVGATPQFRQGRVAMAVTSLSLALVESMSRSTSPSFEWGIAPLPILPGKPGVSVLLGTMTVALPANAVDPIAAWEVAEVVATQGHGAFPTSTVGLSAYASDAEVEDWIARMLPDDGTNKRDAVREILLDRPSVFDVRDLASQEFREGLFEQANLLLLGETTPEEAFVELTRLRDGLE